MKLLKREESRGIAELGGVKRSVNLLLVPEAKVDDYVIVHAGCAIEILDEKEALKTIELIQEISLSIDDSVKNL